MKKVLMLLLFTFYSFNITNSSTIPNTKDNLKRAYYEYVVFKKLDSLKNAANYELNTNLKYEHLPLGFPLGIENIKLTSTYGERTPHPITGKWSFHSGIDISANKGVEVYSILEGIVLRREYHFMGYGKIIEIKHKKGISTIYAHLNETFVKRGDSIKPGQVIGTVGSTGFSTGSHLHYEIRKNSISIDPLSLYGLDKNKVFQNIKIINNELKLLKMETKEIVKTLSLEELKELKDKTVKSINSVQYSIKNGHVKKEASFEKALEKIEAKQENLIRIKTLLAKANSLEFNNEDKEEEYSNNTNIFKLALYRDLKKTLTESPKESFSELKNSKKEEILKKIDEIDSEIREFNKNTKVEIALLEQGL